ncbi:MAG: hypothetical protein QXJ38_04210 [Thermofilaceae archaeon]
MEELVRTLRRLAEAEKSYANELRELAKSVERIAPLSAIIEAVASDSDKHASIYEALLKIATGASQPRLAGEELELIANVIDRHIQTELKMIEESKKLLNEARDARMQLLLAAIYEDEVKHHKVLTDIKDKIARFRVLTDEEFWEQVWKDSPWHGTPGG